MLTEKDIGKRVICEGRRGRLEAIRGELIQVDMGLAGPWIGGSGGWTLDERDPTVSSWRHVCPKCAEGLECKPIGGLPKIGPCPGCGAELAAGSSFVAWPPVDSPAHPVSPCRAGGIGCSWKPWQDAMGCRTPDEARARAEHAKLQLRVAVETCAEYRQRAERAATERDEARNEIERLRRQIGQTRTAEEERADAVALMRAEAPGASLAWEAALRAVALRIEAGDHVGAAKREG